MNVLQRGVRSVLRKPIKSIILDIRVKRSKSHSCLHHKTFDSNIIKKIKVVTGALKVPPFYTSGKRIKNGTFIRG